MAPRKFQSFSEITEFIWSLADLLRGDYRQSEYGKVILPLTVIRRMDSVLEPTRAQVRAKKKELDVADKKVQERVLSKISGVGFYNDSKFDFPGLLGDPDNLEANFLDYIEGFSFEARDIIDNFDFRRQVKRLKKAKLLYLLTEKFANIDLNPDSVSNADMGAIFEDLIRRFSEQSNETAGEHFTPREVIRLMVHLLFGEDTKEMLRPQILKTLYDPTAGTGGMLTEADEYIHEHNPEAELKVYGQELNGESYAICKADLLIKGEDSSNIVKGNSFTEDGHADKQFDYMLSNPPFGVNWKKVQKEIEREQKEEGFDGRFGAGTPRVSDGSLLFLQHMISKMKPVKESIGGTRIAVVFNGSPLFSGDAGSGESEIRKWIIENDWLEAIVALPKELFYNTGIHTYIWVVTNDKSEERKGKVQLIDARDFFVKMKKSLGNKRNQISDEQIASIAQIHAAFHESEHSKIFDNEDFGYKKITVERPVQDNYQASEERIARLKDQTSFQNLAKSRKKGERGEKEVQEGKKLQENIVRVLEGLPSGKVYKNCKEFEGVIKKALNEHNLSVTASVRRAIMSALAERDETADICKKKGKPQADTNLRDTESVPLKETIEEYFEREVKPFIPKAWVDESKTTVGYEIPFTRYFYKYEAPRPLAEIEAEALQLEAEIEGMLEEVLA